jgi:predicted dehydrogenase
MLRIGVLGTGHLGKIHLKCIGQLADRYALAGFFDPSEEVRQKVADEFGVRPYATEDELISNVDVVDVVAPTHEHYRLVRKALEAGKHVFTEKPVTESVEEAAELKSLVDKTGLKLQVGHVERYNPAFLAIQPLKPQPMFVEGHRLAQFNPRGTDVSVVHDLMIHDIDILVSLIPYEVANVYASGVAVVSEQPDICNARVEFVNGAVANLTASRISLKNMRKLRMFQRDAYLSVDFLEKKSEMVRLYHEDPHLDDAFPFELRDKSKWIQIQQPDVEPNNAIVEELRSFHDAISMDRTPDVTIDEAVASMRIVQQILNAIESSASKVRF